MSTSSTSVSSKAYQITFTHTAGAPLPHQSLVISYCWATDVSDPFKYSKTKDKCLIFQLYCSNSGGNWATSGINPSLHIGSYGSNGITIGVLYMSVVSNSIAYNSSNNSISSSFLVNADEARALGLPDSLTPSYKVDLTCWYETKSGYSSRLYGQTTASFLPATKLSFSMGSGAVLTSIGVLGTLIVISFLG